MEILRLIAQGFPNKEIGQQLHTSLQTVKRYTRQIYPKLDVNNRTQAAQRARELGYLEIDPERAVRLLGASNAQLESYELVHQDVDQLELLECTGRRRKS